MKTVVTAIAAEASIEEHPLLIHEAKSFWTTILTRNPSEYLMSA